MSIDLALGVTVFYVIVGITLLVYDLFICGGYSDVIEYLKEEYPWMDERVLTAVFYAGVILGAILWPATIIINLVEE